MNKKAVGLEVILIHLILFSSILQISATTVWSDDFNDGNHDDWTVVDGDFVVGTKGGHECLYPQYPGYGMIKRESVTSVGTWSFDVLSGDDTLCYIFFMSKGEPSAQESVRGYYISLRPLNDGHVLILLKTNPSYEDTERYESDVDVGDWLSITVIRTETGRIIAFLEDTPILEATYSAHTSSDYFVFKADPSYALDNVVVSDSIDRELPEEGWSETTSTYQNTIDSITTTTTPSYSSGLNITPEAVILLGLGISLLLVAKIIDQWLKKDIEK